MEKSRSIIWGKNRFYGVALALLALVLVPFFLSDFLVVFATEMLIMVLFALSFNLLFGYTGLLSFGHAAYFSIGAYGTGLFLSRVSPSLLLAFLIGIVFSFIVAFLIGYFCVRLDEIYFAMLTLAFGMMVHAILWKWDSLTGGADGLVGIPRPKFSILLATIEFSSIPGYYYLTLVVVGICVFILWRVSRSPFGLVLKSIRENHERVEFLGIAMRRYRLGAFVISGTFCGVAGALFAPFERSIAPDISFWTKSAEPVFMSLLGGTKVFFGPAVGASLFMYLREIISGYTELWMIYLGAILIAFVIFLPGGILGFISDKLNAGRRGT
ncbi:MAG: branched-chain amino acid ABC transporter permease [Proteobacteria bacterium]|nr:branched-chain amino acid ABC transporter permease [Pseudomonadota bacterium]NIS71999.1 branched-chain amino acid ABC transporter permease [Pseudomonadota bacterium]